MATQLPSSERSGRQVSFWMSHEELAGLEKRAEKDHCSRNEAARRAVRDYIR